MGENENGTIGDLLIWVTLIGAGTFGLEGLCIHWVKADWMKLILILTGLAGLVWETRTEARGKAAPARSGKLAPSEAVMVFSTAMSFFPIVFLPGNTSSPLAKVLLLIAFFPVMVYAVYRGRRKKEAEARKEEERLREPLVLRDQVSRSARKAYIVCSHAREVDLEFEVDDRMFLYSLPDGRFLVLFRKDVPLDAFLGTLADFRAEVDADEDAIGCYGLPHDGPRPDLPLFFVCDKEGESRPFDFNPSTVSISSAVPV